MLNGGKSTGRSGLRLCLSGLHSWLGRDWLWSGLVVSTRNGDGEGHVMFASRDD